MNIDRCVCFQRTFAELYQIARTKGIDNLEELQKVTEFGKKCKLCHPYIREMLKTGEICFHRVIVP